MARNFRVSNTTIAAIMAGHTYLNFSDRVDVLVAAAKERGLKVTLVTPAFEVREALTIWLLANGACNV